MTGLECILAAPDLTCEPEMVAQAPDFQLRIVRRCLDAADLMAVAALEPQMPILVTPGLPRLARELVSRLSVERLVVGLAHDDDSAQQLLGLGIGRCVLVRAVDLTLMDVRAVLLGQPVAPTRGRQQGVWSTGAWAPEPTPRQVLEIPGVRPSPSRGGVVSVWGAPGSPGRTSALLLLGRLIAEEGRSVCLIDADTSAPSLLQVCGIAETASGLVVACRFAERDTLDAQRLRQTAHEIQRGLWALGGVGHPDQWADVRAFALSSVIAVCRATFDLTLIDLGVGLEATHPTELLAVPRFEAASSALAASDALLAVVEASALGITRFLQHRPSTIGLQMSRAAVALTPPRSGGSALAGAASLRDYGIEQPTFPLPRYTTEEIVNSGHRGLARSRRRRAAGLTQLRSWIAESVELASGSYGEGSTTTAVPTRANL